jgi:GT2 family glycosyltransferase
VTETPGPVGAAPVALPVCIIIVTYNRLADLRRCLKSLHQMQPAVARVMVVDNGSTDGTLTMTQAEYPWVELHVATGNLGPCIARNAAAAASNEALLWFLDSDTEIVDIASAARLVALFDRPETQAVGGEAVMNDGGTVVGTKCLRLTNNALVQGDVAGSDKPISSCSVIASCNLMIRRSTFERLGGFDPFYFFFYEDIDLTWRAGAEGALLALSPMPVIHRYSESVRIRSLWPESRNRMYFILKNLPWWRFAMLPVLDVLTLVRVDSIARLLLRSRQRGGAISLVTLPGTADRPSRAATIKRAALLIFRMAAKLAMAYAAIPVVLGPALAARRHPRGPAAVPAGPVIKWLGGGTPGMAP